jgi:hypothetical protein
MSTRSGSPLTVFAVAFVLCALTCVPSVATANQSLDEVLGEIEWSDTRDEVLEKLKSQMFESMRQRADVQHNRVKLQEIRKRMVDKFEEIENSHTELEGEKTGYEVSVISGEYTKNNNESVLTVEDDAAQRYYFFVDGRFYKMVVAYRQSYLDGISFEGFIGQVSRKYGEPKNTTRREIAGEQTLARATWKGSKTLLHAKNKRELFGTFAMVFSDRQRIEKMKANDETIGGSDKNEAQVSDRVESLKEASGKDKNAEVVDGMLSDDVELDISHEQEGKDLDEQGPAGDASKTDEEGKEEKQASKQTGDSTGGDSTGSSDQSSEDDREEDRDFSNISSESEKKDDSDKEDDELIIY